MIIRDATHQDAAAICAIWNPVIRDTGATFNSIEKTEADITDIVKARPIFVADRETDILGFATYFPFRGGIGYAQTCEHTIIVDPKAQGTGTGRALMDHLIDHARAAGIHSLWAGVSAENPDGVAFHARLGFTEVARLPEVGRKFDRWMDLILMQKLL